MRSKLFVPASRPELFAKALAGAADALSFDLEDAVEPSRRPEARGYLIAFLDQLAAAPAARAKRIVVRVNAVGSADFEPDLVAVVRPGPDTLNLPMCEEPDEVRHAAERLDALEQERGIARPIAILANIESPRGLHRAREIALAHPRLMGLQIGYGDLFAPLGIAPFEPSATQAVRFAVRMAAAEAGIDAYDGAFVAIDRPEDFSRDALAARQLGFAGKSCIHPSQIALANEAFRPSDSEIAHALRVVQAARDALSRGVGAFVVDGQLVDGPFIARAERVVEIARRLGNAAATRG